VPQLAARGGRLALALVLVAALAGLAARSVLAFDRGRHRAAAAAVLAAPDAVTRTLPAAGGAPPGAGGELRFRPGVWLSVVRLHGLEPVAGHDRYLIFLRNWAGWTLAGTARPDAAGAARVGFAAEPRPPTIFEVIVTRGVDNATSVPHGRPVLHWYDQALAPARARPFDFARGA
jgi:hypothetical protein